MRPDSTCRQCLRCLDWTSGINTHTAKRKWKPANASSNFPNARTSKSSMQTSSIHTAASRTIPQTSKRRSTLQIRSQSTRAAALPDRLLLKPGDLFHSFSESPLPAIRRRAAFMKSHAYCPHPDHHPNRVPAGPYDLEARKLKDKSNTPPAHVQFECPDCGLPVYCSEEHWVDDYETHMGICDTLRQANEDDHDLRSGRDFPEFEYPPPQIEEILTNMTNWDTYLYTREYRAINEPRSLRQATRLLTYPMTIASVLHELSPYNIRRGGRLTVEGLRSLTGERVVLG